MIALWASCLFHFHQHHIDHCTVTTFYATRFALVLITWLSTCPPTYPFKYDAPMQSGGLPVHSQECNLSHRRTADVSEKSIRSELSYATFPGNDMQTAYQDTSQFQ